MGADGDVRAYPFYAAMSPDLFAGEKIHRLRAAETPKAEWLRDGMFGPKYQLVADGRLFAFYKTTGIFRRDAEFATADGCFRIVQPGALSFSFAIERIDGGEVATIEVDTLGAGALKFGDGRWLELGSQHSTRCTITNDAGVVLAHSWNQFFERALELRPGFDTCPEVMLAVVMALHIAQTRTWGAVLWWW